MPGYLKCYEILFRPSYLAVFLGYLTGWGSGSTMLSVPDKIPVPGIQVDFTDTHQDDGGRVSYYCWAEMGLVISHQGCTTTSLAGKSEPWRVIHLTASLTSCGWKWPGKRSGWDGSLLWLPREGMEIQGFGTMLLG